MARKRKAANPTQAATAATLENVSVTTPPADEASRRAAVAEGEPRQPATEAATPRRAYAADPHSKISVSLSDYRGGPSMHLLRSHRFRQMQVRFDREQPDEKYLALLKQAGWTDRTESEGVWTKQIDPNARWQSVQQMEREFRDVANAIRRDKGMEPVLDGFAVA